MFIPLAAPAFVAFVTLVAFVAFAALVALVVLVNDSVRKNYGLIGIEICVIGLSGTVFSHASGLGFELYEQFSCYHIHDLCQLSGTEIHSCT